MSPKLKSHQNLNVSKTDIKPKLKYQQNWNVTKTEMSAKLDCSTGLSNFTPAVGHRLSKAWNHPILGKKNLRIKIPHTGDKASLNRCG